MFLKEKIREIMRSQPVIEKIWFSLMWMKANHYARRYDDLTYVKRLWVKEKGYEPNFSHPTTYDEKMWFLKLSNRDPLLTQCSDKHLVRQYVIQCGFPEILKTEYAFYSSANDINFSSLPNKCYFKCNHASGWNYLYERGKEFNQKQFCWRFNFWLKQNPYYLSREWNYKNIVPGIVCEEVIEMPDGYSDIPEIQFFCFHGEPKFIMYNLGLADKDGNHKKAMRWCFDAQWNHLNIKTKMNTDVNIPNKPKDFEKMLKIAEKLSSPFPHVRVDLFYINGRVLFNEMTFYSGGGFVYLAPIEWQNILGEWLDVSSYCIAPGSYQKHSVKHLRDGGLPENS